MAISRAQKIKMIEEVGATLSASEVVIVTHNKGLTVSEVSALRAKMREAGASYRVVKNRLALRTIEGTPFAGVSSLLKGPTALATSKDPVAAAKVAVEFAKTNEKLVVLGGAFGEKPLSVKDVEALATLPSLDALRGKLIGLLQAPAQRIASILQAPAGQVARVIGAHARKE